MHGATGGKLALLGARYESVRAVTACRLAGGTDNRGELVELTVTHASLQAAGRKNSHAKGTRVIAGIRGCYATVSTSPRSHSSLFGRIKSRADEWSAVTVMGFQLIAPNPSLQSPSVTVRYGGHIRTRTKFFNTEICKTCQFGSNGYVALSVKTIGFPSLRYAWNRRR